MNKERLENQGILILKPSDKGGERRLFCARV